MDYTNNELSHVVIHGGQFWKTVLHTTTNEVLCFSGYVLNMVSNTRGNDVELPKDMLITYEMWKPKSVIWNKP